MRFIKLIPVLALFFSAIPAQAQSYDWSATGKVTTIEATYMPSGIFFKMDAGAAGCAVGSNLNWNPPGADAATKAQNAQAIFALLMTAEAADRTVTVYGSNISNSYCSIIYVYIN